MRSKRSTAVLLTATAAAALAVAVPTSAGAGSTAAATSEAGSSATRTAAGAAPAAPRAQAARRIRRRAVATRRRGVRRIAGVRVGPLRHPRTVHTLAQMRRRLGKPLSVRGGKAETCTVRWRGGLEMLFVTFGGPLPCARRPLQTATLEAPRWRVEVGKRTYRIGMPRRRIPRRARYIEDWGGGGYVIGTMRFLGPRDPAVLAHVSDGRIDRFVLFIGGAGD